MSDSKLQELLNIIYFDTKGTIESDNAYLEILDAFNEMRDIISEMKKEEDV